MNKRHEYLIFVLKNGNELEGLKHLTFLGSTEIMNKYKLFSLTFSIPKSGCESFFTGKWREEDP